MKIKPFYIRIADAAEEQLWEIYNGVTEARKKEKPLKSILSYW